MLSEPESLSITEQLITIWSVDSSTTLLPANSSSDEPTGMGASCSKIAVPFCTVFAPELNAPPLADVLLTNFTVAVTCDVCMLLNINPNTIVVVVGVLGAV